MTSEPLQLDELSEPHVQIMQAYTVRAAAGKSAENFDGWLERVSELGELNLSSTHLIFVLYICM